MANTIGKANIEVGVNGADRAKKELSDLAREGKKSVETLDEAISSARGADRLREKLERIRRETADGVGRAAKEVGARFNEAAESGEAAFARTAKTADKASISIGGIAGAASKLQAALGVIAIPIAVTASALRLYKHLQDNVDAARKLREEMRDIGRETDRATQRLAAQGRQQPEAIQKQIDVIQALQSEIRSLVDQYDELAEKETAIGAVTREVQQLYSDEDITRGRQLATVAAQIEDKQRAIQERIRIIRDTERQLERDRKQREAEEAAARARAIKDQNALLEVAILRKDADNEAAQIAAADIASRIQINQTLDQLRKEQDEGVKKRIRERIKLLEEQADTEIKAIQEVFAERRKREDEAERKSKENHEREMERIAQQKRAYEDLGRTIERALNFQGSGLFGTSSIDNLARAITNVPGGRGIYGG